VDRPAGALLVDTRPVEQRERDGEVPGGFEAWAALGLPVVRARRAA
jgi:hypothetical protein